MAAEPSSLRIPIRLPSWVELNRRVSALSQNVLSALNGWRSQAPNNDWVPEGDDQWIGDEDQMPRGVAVGKPTGDPATPGIQGVMVERTGAQDGGGGVALVGYRDQDVDPSIPDPGVLANAPVEIAGVPVLIANQGGVLIETPDPLTDLHYLLLGQTTTLPDGRHFAPLQIGSTYVPAQQDAITDNRNLELNIIGTPQDVFPPPGLVLTNNYTPNVSTFGYEVRLSEEGGRSTIFTLEIYLNNVLVPELTDEYTITGQALNVSYSTPVTSALSAGDEIRMEVSAIGSNPNSDPWVRGLIRNSSMYVRQ